MYRFVVFFVLGERIEHSFEDAERVVVAWGEKVKGDDSKSCKNTCRIRNRAIISKSTTPAWSRPEGVSAMVVGGIKRGACMEIRAVCDT